MTNEETIMTAQTGMLAGQAANQQAAAQNQQYFLEEREKNLAEAQLECEKTLTKIFHKLKQDILQPTDDGRMEWIPIDPEKRTFTDELVNKCMSVMETYINKETLLSNFDTEIINQRMLAFCLALNGNLYGKYEIYFRVPTLEECHAELEAEINKKVETRKISNQLMGIEQNEKEIRQDVIKEYGASMEDEIKRILDSKMAENLREYELLFTQLKAIVEATHHRAFRGEERGSLRRHTSISEVLGNQPTQQKTGGWFGLGKK